MSHPSPSSHESGQARASIIFASVAVILLFVTAGALYLARQRSNTLANADHSTSLADNSNQGNSSNNQSNTSPTQPQKTGDKNGSTGSSNGSSATTQPQQSQSQSGGVAQTQPAQTAPQQQSPAPGKTLPSTGPVDTLGSLIALSMLALVGTSYLRSRQALVPKL